MLIHFIQMNRSAWLFYNLLLWIVYYKLIAYMYLHTRNESLPVYKWKVTSIRCCSNECDWRQWRGVTFHLVMIQLWWQFPLQLPIVCGPPTIFFMLFCLRVAFSVPLLYFFPTSCQSDWFILILLSPKMTEIFVQ